MPLFSDIENCISEFVDLDWFLAEGNDDKQLQRVLFLDVNSKKLFNGIVKIVISGDYFCIDNINTRLDNVINRLGNNFKIEAKVDENDYIDIYNIAQTYSNWLLNFRAFYAKINNQLTDPTCDWSIDLYIQVDNENSIIPTISRYTLFLNYIIKLFNLDFFLSDNVDQIGELLEIRDRLKDPSFNVRLSTVELRPILIEKCNLLLLKIERSKLKKYKYLLNGIEDSQHKEGKYFSKYRIDLRDRENVESLNSRTSLTDDDAWQLMDYYVSMKFVKDESSSVQDGDLLLQRYADSFKPDNIFDRWAYNVSYVYLYNNILSLKLKDRVVTFEELLEIYRNTLALQSKKSIKNYFPFLKISECINRIVRNKISSLNEVELRRYLSLLNKSNERLVENFEWSKNHLKRSFQPFFSECRVNFGDISIFTASAYIVPIDYTFVEEQFRKVKEDSALSRGFVDTLRLNSRLIENTADKKIEKLQVENRELLKKNVEVLSIFAAIVLFVVGNIQLFIQLTTLKSALMFMLVFAYAISMFVLLIRLTTRNYHDIRKGIGWKKVLNFNLFETIHLVLMTIATVSILLILFFSKDIVLANKDNSKEKDGKVMVDIRNHAEPMIQNHANSVQKR
ncbi:hypothetical protein [uncultured Acetobacteroides sp.]|uniref:hypothetical protein n=1 Tax=uncultured Acetobacteroides sp. TaxID=1760811 RepID=UPI0029F49234|nr:hypothetical protein [uncultured Acetobacteroides sp.]